MSICAALLQLHNIIQKLLKPVSKAEVLSKHLRIIWRSQCWARDCHGHHSQDPEHLNGTPQKTEPLLQTMIKHSGCRVWLWSRFDDRNISMALVDKIVDSTSIKNVTCIWTIWLMSIAMPFLQNEFCIQYCTKQSQICAIPLISLGNPADTFNSRYKTYIARVFHAAMLHQICFEELSIWL